MILFLALSGSFVLLGFTKMVLSLWSVTMISLFVRVQVNILGRHLYIDIARSQESSPLIVSVGFLYMFIVQICFHYKTPSKVVDTCYIVSWIFFSRCIFQYNKEQQNDGFMHIDALYLMGLGLLCMVLTL